MFSLEHSITAITRIERGFIGRGEQERQHMPASLAQLARPTRSRSALRTVQLPARSLLKRHPTWMYGQSKG